MFFFICFYFWHQHIKIIQKHLKIINLIFFSSAKQFKKTLLKACYTMKINTHLVGKRKCVCVCVCVCIYIYRERERVKWRRDRGILYLDGYFIWGYFYIFNFSMIWIIIQSIKGVIYNLWKVRVQSIIA